MQDSTQKKDTVVPQSESGPAKKQGSESSQDSMAQVRELLFGQQSRDFQAKLSKLESLLDQRFTKLYQNMEAKFAELSETLNQVQDKLQDTLSAESRERLTDVEKLNSSLNQALNSIDSVQQESEHARNELNKHFSTQLGQLETSSASRHQSLLQKLESVQNNLSETKTDRTMLAKLLQTMADEIEQAQVDSETA